MNWRIGRLLGMVALAAVVVFAIGYWVTRSLVADKAADPPSRAATTDNSPGLPPSTTTGSSSPTATARPCGSVATVDDTGQPLSPGAIQLVQAVHGAACRRDYEALAGFMDNPFRGSPPSQIVQNWQTRDPDGARLDILTALLETKGRVDQGGITFCQKEGIVAFSRGTGTHPGKWSEYAIFIFDERSEWFPGTDCS